MHYIQYIPENTESVPSEITESFSKDSLVYAKLDIRRIVLRLLWPSKYELRLEDGISKKKNTRGKNRSGSREFINVKKTKFNFKVFSKNFYYILLKGISTYYLYLCVRAWRAFGFIDNLRKLGSADFCSDSDAENMKNNNFREHIIKIQNNVIFCKDFGIKFIRNFVSANLLISLNLFLNSFSKFNIAPSPPLVFFKLAAILWIVILLP